jgi:hypothetical protein
MGRPLLPGEPLPGDQITRRPLETAPLEQLAIKRITIIAAAAGESIVVLNIHSSSHIGVYPQVPQV